MTDLVLSETREGVTVLTLNRPEKLNALNYALIDRLLVVLDAVEVDGSVRAVILTGAGERAFSAGGDIHEFSGSVARGADVALRDFVMRGQRLTDGADARVTIDDHCCYLLVGFSTYHLHTITPHKMGFNASVCMF